METNTSFTMSLDSVDLERGVADTVDGNPSTNMSSETNGSTSQECKDIKNGVKGNIVEDPLKKCRLFPKVVNETDEYTEELFKMLSSNQEDEFIEFITNLDIGKSKRASLNCYNGEFTYLQYACMHGLPKVAKYLIDSKADLCAVGYVNRYEVWPSLFLAIFCGNFSIAEYIIESDSKQLFMQNFVHRSNIFHIMACTEEAYSDVYLNFLGYLFGKIKALLLSDMKKEARYLLDEKDLFGKTPLNLADERGFYYIVIYLLERGVDILNKNEHGECELLYMDPRVFETFLNRKINQSPYLDYLENENYIRFNYTSLVPPECFEKHNVSEETSRILYLSELPDFRHLINHPVVSTFIHLKWQKVKWIFYFNLLVYFTFCLLFTQYILLHKESQTCYFIILVICVFYLIIRELLQIYISPLGYLRQLDNWVEIPLIVTTLLTMFSNISIHQELSAVSIFLTWTELILLIGRHPIVSTQVEMYKKVSSNFFNFLSFYFLFVVAFALSFYILSRDTNPDHSSVTQTISNLTITIYDTLVRFVDLKPETLPIEDHPVIGRSFLLMYLLLIAVIMLNLLNGLAVSDTKAIIDEAKVFGHISRLKLICLVENFAKILGRNFMKRIKLFYSSAPTVQGFYRLSTKDFMINIVGDLYVPCSYIVPSDLIKAKQMIRNSFRDPIEINVMKLLSRGDFIQNKLVQNDDKVKIVSDKVKLGLFK